MRLCFNSVNHPLIVVFELLFVLFIACLVSCYRPIVSNCAFLRLCLTLLIIRQPLCLTCCLFGLSSVLFQQAADIYSSAAVSFARFLHVSFVITSFCFFRICSVISLFTSNVVFSLGLKLEKMFNFECRKPELSPLFILMLMEH